MTLEVLAVKSFAIASLATAALFGRRVQRWRHADSDRCHTRSERRRPRTAGETTSAERGSHVDRGVDANGRPNGRGHHLGAHHGANPIRAG